MASAVQRGSMDFTHKTRISWNPRKPNFCAALGGTSEYRDRRPTMCVLITFRKILPIARAQVETGPQMLPFFNMVSLMWPSVEHRSGLIAICAAIANLSASEQRERLLGSER